MSLLYKRIFLLPALLFTVPAGAQNLPALTQTAPADSTYSYTLPQPPEPTLGGGTNVLNYVRTSVPWDRLSTIAAVDNAAALEVQTGFAYKDGFNRTFQALSRANTKAGAYYLDLVQPFDTRVQTVHYDFLPYAGIHTGDIRSTAFADQSAFYQARYPNEGYTAYDRQTYYSNASLRQQRSLAPGKSQTGQGRMATDQQISNGDSDIRVWAIDPTQTPVTPGYYPANVLLGHKSIDAMGHQVFTYNDLSGHKVYEKVQDGATTFAATHYIYDDQNRLRYILPPAATAAADAAGSLTTAVLDGLCFRYVYDEQGRLSAVRRPGETDSTLIVYDRKQRPVMRQTPAEGGQKWEVTFYDAQSRVIATSIFNSTSNRTAWQNVFDNYAGASYPTTDLKYYLVTDAGEGVYPPETAISGNVLLSYSWYDDYRLADPSGSYYDEALTNSILPADLQTGTGALPANIDTFAYGMPTGSRVRIVKTSGGDTTHTGDWRQTVLFYDSLNRVSATVSHDFYKDTLIHSHDISTQYDFRGRALLSRHHMTNARSRDGATGHTEMTRNLYEDITGHLAETDHLVDNGIWNVLAKYSYDSLGRVQQEVLGNYGEVRDYTYTIRGELAGINAHYAETGEDNVSLPKKTFGESLKYDYGFSQPRYDGLVSGMIWRGSGGAQSKALAYGYAYDPAGRLTTADFREGPDQHGSILTPTFWDKDTMDYTLGNLTYDKDGNLLTATRRGPSIAGPSGSVPETIDQLTYTYATSSNQLSAASDTVHSNYGDGDFQDGHLSGTDYTYDADGNLTEDLNKGISSVTYSWQDKPLVVTFTGGNKVTYTYDAAGNKVQELVHTGSGDKRTDYIGTFVYQADSLQYISTGAGRSIVKDSAKEEYFVKDHLGNVRSTIDVYQYPILTYLATYEIASAQLEGLFFDNIDSIRTENPLSTDPSDTKSGLLNGNDSRLRTGTSILMKVMAGDQVQLNVNTYYDNYNPNTDEPIASGTMLSSVVSTLTGGSGGLGGSESHDPTLVGHLFTSTNYNQFATIQSDVTDTHKPRAYLNYILFDAGMHIVTSFTGAFQATGNGAWTQVGTTTPLVIPQNGYLAVFESNATDIGCSGCTPGDEPGNVWFDQMQVQFTRGSLKEENHYYPYGLPMAGLNSTAAGFTPNRHKYQDNEYITDAGLNWMDFNARQYDPQLSRFLSIDPMGDQGGQESLSPYAGMGDEPVLNSDPAGMLVGQVSSPNNVHGASLPAGFSAQFYEDMYGGGNIDIDLVQDGVDWSGGTDQKNNQSFWDNIMDAADNSTGSQTLYSNGSFASNDIGTPGGNGGDDNPQAANPQNADGSDASATSVSNKGIDFIKSWESYSSTAYDASGKAHRGDWTIGWGHKILAGEDFSKGITIEQADALFLSDLQKKAVSPILKYVTVSLSQQQFDALASYVFNSGVGNTLIKTQLIRQLNQGNYSGAVLQIDITQQQGNIMRGLVQRRQDEQNIWINGYYNMHQ